MVVNDAVRSYGVEPDGVLSNLAKLITERKVLPFIGAGFSSVAGLPGWMTLLRRIFDDLPMDEDFDDVARACGDDPLRLAEYLLICSGGKIGPMRHRMTAILRTDRPFISSAHIDLLNLSAPAIYTTNFDELLEHTFQLLRLPADICITFRDLTRTSTGRTQLVKFHGDLQYDDTLVLTESAFLKRLEFESPMDLKFRGDILGRSLLFIGYGFGDVNIRAIWSKLSRLMQSVPEDERPPSFIVRLHHNPVVEILGRAARLTTIILDPNNTADTSEKRQALLEIFMLQLTWAAGPTAVEPEERLNAPSFCSPRLLKEAVRIVRTAPPELSRYETNVLESVTSRRLRPEWEHETAGLLDAFSSTTGPQLREYSQAFALNFAMKDVR